jgi:hypothetical protein
MLGVPPHLRERLAMALESGLLPERPSDAALRSVLGGAEPIGEVTAMLAELDRLGVSGQAAAVWLRTIAKAESRLPRPDLVWSGPEVPSLHARDTRQVYEELLGSAERSVWASSYAYFDGPRAFEVLARRMDATPNLRVILLLNIQRRRGDTTAAQELVR